MIVCGIDPGMSGAVAVLRAENGIPSIVEIFDMPVLLLGRTRRKHLDYHRLARFLHEIRTFRQQLAEHAYVEQTWNRPGEGRSGKLVGCYEAILGMLAAMQFPFTTPSPQRWKKDLRVPAEKDGARARASQLLPEAAHYWSLKKHDGRAEAAMIAYWGMLQRERVAP